MGTATPIESTSTTPQFIQHEPPVMPAPDISAFLQEGCQIKHPNELECPEASAAASLDCPFLLAPDPILGALLPVYPIAVCQHGYDMDPKTGDFVYDEGCLDHRWVQFVIYRDGQYQVLKRFTDLQAVYAPIESSEEAFSYAVLATGLTPRFDLKRAPEYHYNVNQIEESHVETLDDSFTVNLFKYSTCGCGPKPMNMYTVSVSRDGQVAVSAPVSLFRNPELDQVCGD